MDSKSCWTFCFSLSVFVVFYYISQLSFLFKFRAKIIFRSRSLNALSRLFFLMSEFSVRDLSVAMDRFTQNSPLYYV